MLFRSNELKPLAEKAGLDPVFVALKIEERDCDVMRRVGLDGKCEGNTKCGGCADCEINAASDRPAILRYRYIDAILKDVIEPRGANVRTRKADKILLGEAAGPIFVRGRAGVCAPCPTRRRGRLAAVGNFADLRRRYFGRWRGARVFAASGYTVFADRYFTGQRVYEPSGVRHRRLL